MNIRKPNRRAHPAWVRERGTKTVYPRPVRKRVQLIKGNRWAASSTGRALDF